MIVNAMGGVVEDGKIRLRDPIKLPEKTRVFVVVADPHSDLTAHLRSPRLVD